MTAVFADTSFYIALVNNHDKHHHLALELTETLRGTSVSTAWVHTELANFLSRSANRPLFLALWKDLQEDGRVTIVPPSEELFHQGLDLYARRPDKDWSLTDCISFVVMEQLGLTDALTTDHHFEQAGFRTLLR